MKKMFRDKWIEVELVHEFLTSWGCVYELCKVDEEYFVTEDDDGKYIIPLYNGKYNSDIAAIKEFEEYMKNIEKENVEARKEY